LVDVVGLEQPGYVRLPLATAGNQGRVVANEILTIPEVARLLRIGQRTAYTLAREGKLPAVRIGNQWRFHLPKIMAFIDAGGVATSTGLGDCRRG
jgi:excisionase family DNA binding protein